MPPSQAGRMTTTASITIPSTGAFGSISLGAATLRSEIFARIVTFFANEATPTVYAPYVAPRTRP